MLSLKRSSYRINALQRFAGVLRFSSVVKKNEIVVSEVKHLAAVAIKLYNSRDLDQQLKLLRNIRSANTSARQVTVTSFGERYPRIASTWLSEWIAKSVVDGTTAKLFPVIIPVDDAKLSLGVKTDLANAAFAIKTSRMRAGAGTIELEQLRAQAMKLADELGNNIHIDRLRVVGSTFQDFVDAQVSVASFLDELVLESGLFANELLPILEFTELPLPEQVRAQLQSSEQDRQTLHSSLVNELTYITHVANSSRFNVEKPDESPAAGEPVSAMELLKELPDSHLLSRKGAEQTGPGEEKEHLRRTVIIGKASDFAGFEPCSLLQMSDTGLVHTRRAIDARRKLRFTNDMFLFNVKAPCYRVGQSLQGLARRDAATSSLNFDHGLFAISMDAAMADPADLPDNHTLSPVVDGDALHESMPNRKIMIDNLPRNITEAQLRYCLRKCGNIEKVWIYKDERATPEEVKYMDALRLRAPRTEGTFVDLKNTEGPFNLKLQGTMLLPSTDRSSGEHRATTAGEVDSDLIDDADLPGETVAVAVQQEEPGVSSYEKLLREQAVMKLPTKQKLLRGSLKTDNYAFVLMADEPSYQLISKPAVRLFGITIGDRSCRVYPSHIYKSFMLEIGQELDVRGIVEFVNTLLKGKYECYAAPTYQNCKPVFLHLQFENATDAWIAHDLLMRALDELNRNSMVLTRNLYWKARATHGPRKQISINLSWIKSQWYKEWFFRASKYLERKEDKAAEQQASAESAAAAAAAEQGALATIDIDAVEEFSAAKRSRSRPSPAPEGADGAEPTQESKPAKHGDNGEPEKTEKKGKATQPKLIKAAKGAASASASHAMSDTVSLMVKTTAAYSTEKDSAATGIKVKKLMIPANANLMAAQSKLKSGDNATSTPDDVLSVINAPKATRAKRGTAASKAKASSKPTSEPQATDME